MIINDLKERGVFDNITNLTKFENLPPGSGVYIGFDPTAKSLHLGNYLQIMTLKRFQKHSFQTYGLVGGATGMIGDPSGKSHERTLLDQSTVQTNKKRIAKQLKFFDIKVIDNLDFYKSMTAIEFLRDVGKLVNINYLLSKEAVKNRLQAGLSFTEFSYPLIQGWDFKSLYENNKIFTQIGGSDQWGNITTGVEIIRKTIGDQNYAVGITTNLLITSSGKKFGKSEAGAIWLDKTMTKPYVLYQYLLNSTDDDVEKLLKWLTTLPLEEIHNLISDHLHHPSQRIAQKKLAFQVVSDIHTKATAVDSEKISNALFGKGNIDALSTNQVLELVGNVPTTKYNLSKNILDTLVEINAAVSRREATEFVLGNAIEVNGVCINDPSFVVEPTSFDKKATIIKKGKKSFYLLDHRK